MTLNEVRSNGFWVVSGSSVVASMISSCVKCQRLRGAVQEQRMSDLPEDRLESTPPFTYCAVDFFGPFVIKERRKELKRYGVLFTCMTSRAIHIEIANSLETDLFINALRRFISRRGPIRQLRSDQGTNFVGARTELTQALAEMNQDKIKKKLLEEQCDWFTFKMNVPAASHMGSVWEWQIRTVRNVLASLLQDNGWQLDNESLRTLMCKEAIVNSCSDPAYWSRFSQSTHSQPTLDNEFKGHSCSTGCLPASRHVLQKALEASPTLGERVLDSMENRTPQFTAAPKVVTHARIAVASVKERLRSGVIPSRGAFQEMNWTRNTILWRLCPLTSMRPILTPLLIPLSVQLTKSNISVEKTPKMAQTEPYLQRQPPQYKWSRMVSRSWIRTYNWWTQTSIQIWKAVWLGK